jgi:hypothetical protein
MKSCNSIRKFIFSASAILLLLAGAGTPVYSQQCTLNLPQNAITMTVTGNEYKPCIQLQGLEPPGYLWAYLSGIGPGYSVADGLNPGYCSDLVGVVEDNPVTYEAKLWSSLDPGAPTLIDSLKIPWNKINYLINMYPVPNANYTWLEIQAAIWELVHGCNPGGPLFDCPPWIVNPYYFPFGSSGAGPYGCPPDGIVDISMVKQIVLDANAYEGEFIPGPGEKIAVVVQIVSCSGNTVPGACDPPYQIVFIPAQCPPCTGTIGDFVWHDVNHNGIQDDGSASGINGVEVLLTGTDAYGNSISLSEVTTNNPSTGNPGYYQFEGLCQGNYTVSVNAATVSGGLVPTSPLGGSGDDNVPNDSNQPTGTTVTLTTDSASNQTIDFGYISPCSGSIGDYVWQDLNYNGIQDEGAASGINGVEILLTGMNVYGQSVSMTFTTINNPSMGNPGYYQFSGLCQGNYTVSVNPATVPAGLAQTFPVSSNGNDANGTDSNNPGGTTVNFPDDSTSNQTIDFGYISPCSGSIGDYVWQDLNYNGIQDDGAASGINGVQILLTGINVYGQPVSMIATTANAPSTGNPGYYQFAGLCAGNYTVSVNATTVPAGLILTSPLSANGNDLVPNDSNNPIGTTLSLGTDNDSNQTIDFGYVMATPGIVVTKACTDASAAGQPINFSAVITNTGNETLNNITCSDDKAGTLIVPVPSLAPGASTTVTGSYVPTTSPSTDTVTCSGTGAISNIRVSNSSSATCKINTAIGRGDTATIGFWHNKNGQALILSFNGGGSSTKLGDWLAATFPCLYGSLAGKQNSVVALQFLTYFNVKGQKTYAQILAGALASYATSSTLAGGNMAAAYGFNVSSTGTGAKTYNVGSNGTAIGLANNTSYTVLQLLNAANQKCPFGTSGAVFGALNTIFDGINQSGDIQ